MSLSKNYKILFLVPVFEQEDCVEDLIQNIQATCPNSAILFHVNSNSNASFYDNIQTLVNFYSFCYLLPNRYPTEWCNGVLAFVFLDMIKYANENINYDYCYFTASNSLVVNPELENAVLSHDVFLRNPYKLSDSAKIMYFNKDENLKNYTHLYQGEVYNCFFEGMVISKQVGKHFVEEAHHFASKTPVHYCSEEVWLATVLVNLNEKHQYNWCKVNLEKWSHIGDHIINDLQLDVGIARDYVCSILAESNYAVLSNMNIYSLKRVNRSYLDEFRTLIRNNFGYSNEIF